MVTEDDWNYGDSASSGVLAFGLNSKWMTTIIDTTTNVASYLLQIGNVADQPFVGANKASAGGGFMYMGAGDYSSLTQTGDKVDLYLNQFGDYDISDMFFGTEGLNTTSGEYLEYYLPIGYSNSLYRVIISTSYSGLGLPWYEWNQLVNMIYRSSENVAVSLLCSGPGSGPVPSCMLTQPCASFTDLWNYNLKIRFDESADVWTSVNIGSFATDEAGTNNCQLNINALEADDESSQNVLPILGSMWLQNFNANFTNDYSGVEKSSLLTLNASTLFNTTNSGINRDTPTQNTSITNAFGYLPEYITLPITVDQNSQIPVVKANFGYQGFANFTFSQTSNLMMAYASNCT